MVNNWKLMVMFFFLIIRGTSYGQQDKFEVIDLKKFHVRAMNLDKYFFSEKLFTVGAIKTIDREAVYATKRYGFTEYEFFIVNADGYYAKYDDIGFEAIGILADSKGEEVVLLGALKVGFTVDEALTFMNALSNNSENAPRIAQEKDGVRYLINYGDKVINVFFSQLVIEQVDFKNNLNSFYNLGQFLSEEQIRTGLDRLFNKEEKSMYCVVYITTKKYDTIFRKGYIPGELMEDYRYEREYYKVK